MFIKLPIYVLNDSFLWFQCLSSEEKKAWCLFYYMRFMTSTSVTFTNLGYHTISRHIYAFILLKYPWNHTIMLTNLRYLAYLSH